MRFALRYTATAAAQRDALEKDPSREKAWKAVRRALALMELDLRHPSLQTHKYHSLKGPNGEEIFESYAQQRTPAAFRVFGCYGPGKGTLTVVAIVPHP